MFCGFTADLRTSRLGSRQPYEFQTNDVPKIRVHDGSPRRGAFKRRNVELRARNFCAFSHCTLILTVAVLLARLGSGVSARVAALSVITVPGGAVTFTVSRTVHVVLGAMPSPS